MSHAALPGMLACEPGTPGGAGKGVAVDIVMWEGLLSDLGDRWTATWIVGLGWLPMIGALVP